MRKSVTVGLILGLIVFLSYSASIATFPNCTLSVSDLHFIISPGDWVDTTQHGATITKNVTDITIKGPNDGSFTPGISQTCVDTNGYTSMKLKAKLDYTTFDSTYTRDYPYYIVDGVTTNFNPLITPQVTLTATSTICYGIRSVDCFGGSASLHLFSFELIVTEDCTDTNPCTIDSCSYYPPLDILQCTYTPNTCDDNNKCTDDSCNALSGCVHTTTNCIDDNICTTDSCDPLTGCVHGAVNCDDNLYCTVDSCNPLLTEGSQCVHNELPCIASDICSLSSCNEEAGKCVETPRDCDDGVYCTIDSCIVPSGCKYELRDCNDNNSCTIDSCNNGQNQCDHIDVHCVDNNLCTTDSCSSSTGCVFTTIDCDDSNICTVDSCSPRFGCSNSIINCDDGNACTSDSCDPKLGCVNTNVCSENGCTSVVDCKVSGELSDCDEVSCIDGECLLKTKSCDDGNVCTSDSCLSVVVNIMETTSMSSA